MEIGTGLMTSTGVRTGRAVLWWRLRIGKGRGDELSWAWSGA